MNVAILPTQVTNCCQCPHCHRTDEMGTENTKLQCRHVLRTSGGILMATTKPELEKLEIPIPDYCPLL